MPQKIFIVEDEHSIRQALAGYFIRDGFDVLQACDGKAALEIFDENVVDLVILDVMLPVLDGWTVLRRIRDKSDVLIIMLTALEDESDKLTGFRCGADEYVTKPFSPKVLVARARALLRRNRKDMSENMTSACGIIFDRESHTVKIGGEALKLTPKEYIMLGYLIENPNRVLSREQMLDKVWGYDYFGDARVVDTHIKNIRKKLGEKSRHILTVTGAGYKFEVDE